MCLESITFLLSHIMEIYTTEISVLHCCLQFIIFISQIVDLLHDIVEILLQISWSSFLQLDRLLCFLFLQIKSLRTFERVAKAISQLMIYFDHCFLRYTSLYPSLSLGNQIACMKFNSVVIASLFRFFTDRRTSASAALLRLACHAHPTVL